MVLLGDADARGIVPLVRLAVEQGSNPDGDFDASATFAPDSLPTELLAVSDARAAWVRRRRLLVLKFVRKLLLRLAERNLGLKACIVRHLLLLHESLLLLLKPV